MKTEQKLSNRNIDRYEVLDPPIKVKGMQRTTSKTEETTINGRKTIENILDGEDNRFLILTGPCSIHDPSAAFEYAKNLKELSYEISNKIYLVMRTYFEKPRTTIGWKGFLSDPYLDHSFNIGEGIKQARKLLININELGVPCATEFLNPIIPQYIDDLISWAAIGARTTESQTHREMASGLSMPVGFKNGTNGSVEIAINGVKSAMSAQEFMGMDEYGKVTSVITSGNKYSHTIIRGEDKKPNYDQETIHCLQTKLREKNLSDKIIVDCSHGNTFRDGEKDYKQQRNVLYNIIQQKLDGNKGIIGAMLESNLNSGKQNVNGHELKYGVSITDACISWEETEKAIRKVYKKL